MFTAAILENGRHGNQDANSQWPNIQISSKYMKLCVYQIWCLYHKMNNMLAMPPHYMMSKTENAATGSLTGTLNVLSDNYCHLPSA